MAVLLVSYQIFSLMSKSLIRDYESHVRSDNRTFQNALPQNEHLVGYNLTKSLTISLNHCSASNADPASPNHHDAHRRIPKVLVRDKKVPYELTARGKYRAYSVNLTQNDVVSRN